MAYGSEGWLGFRISDLVKNLDATDIQHLWWSPEGPVSQIYSPHLNVGAPVIFSDIFRSVQMLKREWCAESNVKLPHLFIPCKTATLVSEFAVEDLPSAELQPWFLLLQWRTCPWAERSDDDSGVSRFTTMHNVYSVVHKTVLPIYTTLCIVVNLGETVLHATKQSIYDIFKVMILSSIGFKFYILKHIYN